MNSTPSHKLVGDIGGTNARFALLDNEGAPVGAQTYPTANYPGIESAIGQFLGDNAVDRVNSASIAVATPVSSDSISFTNNKRWSFSIKAVKNALGLERLHVLNDFTALALSVPHLSHESLVRWGGEDPAAGGAIAVLGPGTGLGVSGLVPNGIGGWAPLSSEGGHVNSPCHTDREIAVYKLFRSKFDHVSAERFLSGPGLVLLHNALRELDGQPAHALRPSDITEKGVSGEDSYCRETLDMFCALLGGCAGNLAVTLGASGGVYIGGGIVPKLGQFFYDSDFRARFDGKGRMAKKMMAMPVFVITEPYPALTGAAQLLKAAS